MDKQIKTLQNLEHVAHVLLQCIVQPGYLEDF